VLLKTPQTKGQNIQLKFHDHENDNGSPKLISAVSK